MESAKLRICYGDRLLLTTCTCRVHIESLWIAGTRGATLDPGETEWWVKSDGFARWGYVFRIEMSGGRTAKRVSWLGRSHMAAKSVNSLLRFCLSPTYESREQALGNTVWRKPCWAFNLQTARSACEADLELASFMSKSRRLKDPQGGHNDKSPG